MIFRDREYWIWDNGWKNRVGFVVRGENGEEVRQLQRACEKIGVQLGGGYYPTERRVELTARGLGKLMFALDHQDEPTPMETQNARVFERFLDAVISSQSQD